MTDEQKIEINMNDLAVLRGVVEAATRAGVFKANDLTIVGRVYDKLNAIVEDFMAKQKELEDAAAEGQEAPATE